MAIKNNSYDSALNYIQIKTTGSLNELYIHY